MIDITNVVASQRVLAHLDEGRLVRGKWHTVRDGRELACVLGSMDPAIDSPTKCPASVMPAWLAWLTVTLFDRQKDADAMAWARRYAGQMARWHVLDDAAWDRVDVEFRVACVETAVSKAEPVPKDLAVWPRVKAACEGVVTALRTGVGLPDASSAAAAAASYAYAYAYAAAAAGAAYAADAAAASYAAAAGAYAAYAADAAAAAGAYAAELAKALCDIIDGELAIMEALQ